MIKITELKGLKYNRSPERIEAVVICLPSVKFYHSVALVAVVHKRTCHKFIYVE
jgi:hypothetical protein